MLPKQISTFKIVDKFNINTELFVHNLFSHHISIHYSEECVFFASDSDCLFIAPLP